MKTLSSFLAILLLICACTVKENPPKNDWTKNRLKGKIKSTMETGYFIDEKSAEIKKGTKIYSTLETYNEKGYLIESDSFLGGGDLFTKTKFKYDEKMNLTGWYMFRPLDSLTLKYTYQYKFDGNGNVIESREYYSDGSLKTKITFRYDGKGNNIGRDEFGIGDSLKQRYIYKYDGRGKITETDEFDGSNTYIKKRRYKYDERGNIIEHSETNAADSLLYKSIYRNTYDEKGNMIESMSYKPDGTLYSRSTIKYDDKGNWINNIYLNFGGRITEREIKYF